MNRYTKQVVGSLGVVLLLALASGCTTTRRYVTHTVSGVGGPGALALEQPTYHVGAEGDELGESEGEGEATAVEAEMAPAPPIPPPVVQSSRATRWMYIAYAEVKETNLFITRSFKTTSKILRCLIKDDNSIDCVEQEAVAGLFNPQNK